MLDKRIILEKDSKSMHGKASLILKHRKSSMLQQKKMLQKMTCAGLKKNI